MPPSLKTLRLFIHELRIITVPIDYHRKCVRGHCACAESRDPWVGGQKRLHFGNPRPRFAYSLCNFRGSTMKVITVICENNALNCVKRRMSFCACAKSRDLLKVSYVSYCSRSRRRRFTVLDFKSWAYRSIYGHFRQHLYCACAETLFMNFRCKFRHRRSIPRPRCPIRVKKFGDSATFSVDFCFLYLNVRHISTSGLFDLLT